VAAAAKLVSWRARPPKRDSNRPCSRTLEADVSPSLSFSIRTNKWVSISGLHCTLTQVCEFTIMAKERHTHNHALFAIGASTRLSVCVSVLMREDETVMHCLPSVHQLVVDSL
jgi:hypothetical protein